MEANVKQVLRKYGVPEEDIDIAYVEILEANEGLQSLEARKEDFRSQLVKNKGDMDMKMLKAFWDYWTERAPKAKKFRFEKEKAFDMKKRLATWKKNQERFSIVGMLNNKRKQ